MAMAQNRPVVYLDANPLSDRYLTGIGRYTARLAMAVHDAGATVRFFSLEREVIPPADLDWRADQDLAKWGHRVWRGEVKRLARVPDEAVGVYTCTRPASRIFPFEMSILYDFTPLLAPWAHSEKTRLDFQYFFAEALLCSDAAIAISHSTKADAAWLCGYPQERIAVVHPGPSICVKEHLEERGPRRRRPEVGLVVSTIEPRKNAPFLLDWFSKTTVLPEDCELWWVGPMGWMMSRRELNRYKSGGRRRIRFLGVVSDRELCGLYQEAEWSVYPSLYEGFGFPVLDALRHGAPTLAGGHSSIREIAAPGLYLFDPCDPKDLDRAWLEMWESRATGRVAPIGDLDRRFRWDEVGRLLLAIAKRRTVGVEGDVKAA